MDGKVGGRAKDAVIERDVRQDFRVLAIPDVDERDRVLPGRHEDRFAGIVP
jgi:hypothetical protein